eukprot:1111190-Ditylum_brightwellii.AAC.1
MDTETQIHVAKTDIFKSEYLELLKSTAAQKSRNISKCIEIRISMKISFCKHHWQKKQGLVQMQSTNIQQQY